MMSPSKQANSWILGSALNPRLVGAAEYERVREGRPGSSINAGGDSWAARNRLW